MLQDLESRVTLYAGAISRAEEFLTSRGLTIADAATYRLGVVCDDSPESAPYKGRVAIPYITPAGVKDIRFRWNLPIGQRGEGPKYLTRPGQQSLIYNVAAFWRDSDTIAICEGEIDAIVMDLYSGIPAVGIPGANVWKSHYAKLFADYERVLVIGDGDQAGREFSRMVASKVEGAVPVEMKEEMDVNDLYLLEGPDAIERLVA